MTAIQTHGLTRVFRCGHGVHRLDLEVPEGAVYGFLGSNGAGKTSTIRLLLGLLRADAGDIRLFGRSDFGRIFPWSLPLQMFADGSHGMSLTLGLAGGLLAALLGLADLLHGESP